jgi:hypothetical protein
LPSGPTIRILGHLSSEDPDRKATVAPEGIADAEDRETIESDLATPP